MEVEADASCRIASHHMTCGRRNMTWQHICTMLLVLSSYMRRVDATAYMCVYMMCSHVMYSHSLDLVPLPLTRSPRSNRSCPNMSASTSQHHCQHHLHMQATHHVMCTHHVRITPTQHHVMYTHHVQTYPHKYRHGQHHRQPCVSMCQPLHTPTSV